MCTPVNPSFTIYIKVGCKGVFITRTCLHGGECELKKRLNFCKQYKYLLPFGILYPNAEVGGLSMRLRKKKKEKKKIKIKTIKAKKKKKRKIKESRQAGNRTTIACVESKDHIR